MIRVLVLVIGTGLPFERKKPPSLVSLCVGVIGKNLEDIIPDLDEISANFPSDVKVGLVYNLFFMFNLVHKLTELS